MNNRSLLEMGFGGGMLTGSDFALNRETPRGAVFSVWSRGAQSSFHGQEGALALNGDARTTMFGTDYASEPLVMGLSALTAGASATTSARRTARWPLRRRRRQADAGAGPLLSDAASGLPRRS